MVMSLSPLPVFFAYNRTNFPVPSQRPTNVTAMHSLRGLIVVVSWASVECFHHNGFITGYVITVTGVDDSEYLTSDTNSIEIEGLTKHLQYTIRVAAINNAGAGPFSDTLQYVPPFLGQLLDCYSKDSC